MSVSPTREETALALRAAFHPLHQGTRCLCQPVTHFIKEQGAFVSLFKHTLPLPHRTGKRPSFVPKEFTVQEAIVKCTTVDNLERSGISRTAFMYGIGNYLFANPSFARNEDSRFCLCNLCNQAINILHRCGG